MIIEQGNPFVDGTVQTLPRSTSDLKDVGEIWYVSRSVDTASGTGRKARSGAVVAIFEVLTPPVGLG